MDIERVAKQGAAGAAFIVNFATGLRTLRDAERRGVGARLTPDQVKAVLDGFRHLKEGRK